MWRDELKLTIPDQFLLPETRNGYEVSAERKKVWAVELDLLMEFDRVCRKHDIPYVASSGTAIGAVREKGFIPWDDDIDLEMLREDYDRLCEIAPDEFQEPYFWQTVQTDPGYRMGHAKLRNSRTTALMERQISKSLFHSNQGIFIDILPMDNTPGDPQILTEQLDKAKKQLRSYRSLNQLDQNFQPSKRNAFYRVGSYVAHFFVGKLHLARRAYDRFEETCREYQGKDCAYVTKLYNPKLKKKMYHKEDYAERIYLPYEFIEIPVMKNYDRYLTTMFGDYMTPVQEPTVHGDMIFDVETPYTEFLSKNEEKMK